MTTLLQQLANGLVLGALYGLVALGYTMVYGILQLINFAHGEVVMVGAFGALTAWYFMPAGLLGSWPVALAIGILVAMVTSVVVALTVERLAYRPLRHAPRLAPLISAIGMSFVLQEIVRIFYPINSDGELEPGVGAKSARAFRLDSFPEGQVTVGSVSVSYLGVIIVVVSVALMAGLQTFVLRSRTGRAMRATAQDPDTTRLMGIDTDRVVVITFALGAALAGVAGVFYGLYSGGVATDMGFLLGLKAFTAAVLGGIGNLSGAVLGGFVLGIVEALATQFIPGGSAYKDAFAFAVLILVLLFRPTGLLGEKVSTRA